MPSSLILVLALEKAEVKKHNFIYDFIQLYKLNNCLPFYYNFLPYVKSKLSKTYSLKGFNRNCRSRIRSCISWCRTGCSRIYSFRDSCRLYCCRNTSRYWQCSRWLNFCNFNKFRNDWNYSSVRYSWRSNIRTSTSWLWCVQARYALEEKKEKMIFLNMNDHCLIQSLLQLLMTQSI